ncbi:hypothetical protein EPN52_14250 [bacterium]|nr:MAG: hypothetical protein EPN52_14250 [bacterium]
MMLSAALAGAGLCAVAAYAGASVALLAVRGLPPVAGAPPARRAPLPLLVAGGGAVGALQAAHGTGSMGAGLAALLIFALSASWTTDVTRGVVFDLFALAPLAALTVAAALRAHWGVPIAALVLALPFALTALLTRGRGMGWGDVELAALGGAVLGIQTAAILFAAVSLAAYGVAMLRRTRGPIAFAPYLATAIMTGLALGGGL